MIVEFLKKSQDNNPFLSLCICTIQSRKKQFEDLGKLLLNYSNFFNVEILYCCDNKEISVGKKRNLLINESTGKFISFLDDDDLISPIYFERIYEASKFFPDVIGMEGIITFNGLFPKKFIHSMKYDHWFEDSAAYYRTPNHLNPIRSELVKQVGFPELNFGEDKNFSDRIYPLLKNEVYIDIPIYFYRYDDNKSETKGR